MFELSKELEKLDLDGTPIRVALIGTGTMGTGFAECVSCAIGMKVDLICDLRLDHAMKAMLASGANEHNIVECETLADAEKALADNKKVITKDYKIACSAKQIQCVYEATGVPDVYALAGIECINHRKHYITMNVEGDVCVGHLMNMWARNAGIIYTGIFGDEPGSAMREYYEAKALGFEILAVGRSDMGGSKLEWNRDSIVPEMKKHNCNYENTSIYASFCDGSKTNEECCMMANACGFRPDVRGMHGPYVEWADFAVKVPELLRPKAEGGILNHTGVIEKIGVPGDVNTVATSPNFIYTFCVVRCKTAAQKDFMVEQHGVKDSDVGLFYSPYHYGSVQAPLTVATAVIDHRAVVNPLEGSSRACDVVTMAKMDIKAGTVIDEIGGYHTTGRVECPSITRNERLLPFALAHGAKVVRDVPKGGFLTLDDIEFQGKPNMIHQMRMLQDRLFTDMY